MKRPRGAQKGNQNAAKPTRKRYVSVFGQRWPVDVGGKILAYLKRQGKTQKQFLVGVVGEKITTENADKEKVMPVYKFNDQQGNRDRSCRYGVIYNQQYVTAEDAQKQKLAVFKSLGYKKNGKWSNTDWEVTTKSAKLIVCMSPFEGWPESVDLCIRHVIRECKRYVGWEPSEEEALIFFQGCYPKTYAKVSEKETAIGELV